MNLLLLTLEYPPYHGGVGRYYHELVKALPKGLVEVLVPKLNKYIWPRWTGVWGQVKAWTRRHATGVIWVGHILPLGTVAWLNHLFFHTPYIVSVHGLDVVLARQSFRKKWLVKNILNKALLVTVNSQYTAELLTVYKVDKQKVIVLKPSTTFLPAVDDDFLKKIKEKYYLRDYPTILAVGRLVPRKGFNKLLATLPAIWSAMPNVQCVIVGDGPERHNLTLQIIDLGSSQVQLVTRSSDQELAAFYKLADLFVLPVQDLVGDPEGFGIVCLEAAQAGLPIIASRVGGVTEAVKDGYNGLLISAGNQTELGETIIKLLKDYRIRQLMGENSQKWASQFNSHDNARILLQELQSRL